eukprot:3165977-Alexandrium_andersonii.AAC.1
MHIKNAKAVALEGLNGGKEACRHEDVVNTCVLFGIVRSARRLTTRGPPDRRPVSDVYQGAVAEKPGEGGKLHG